ncbi:MAG TPA: hypothetical protein VD963_08265 [Phycisphaerales bacterium]|nr:hypothetical protein [Phycisphaerales bacterium]
MPTDISMIRVRHITAIALGTMLLGALPFLCLGASSLGPPRIWVRADRAAWGWQAQRGVGWWRISYHFDPVMMESYLKNNRAGGSPYPLFPLGGVAAAAPPEWSHIGGWRGRPTIGDHRAYLATETAIGWPFRSATRIEATAFVPNDTLVSRTYDWHPIGQIGNVGLYGFSLTMLTVGLPAWVRAHRRRRGLCPACRYPSTVGVPECPECGTPA